LVEGTILPTLVLMCGVLLALFEDKFVFSGLFYLPLFFDFTLRKREMIVSPLLSTLLAPGYILSGHPRGSIHSYKLPNLPVGQLSALDTRPLFGVARFKFLKSTHNR
jgi:hypothetical protein